MTKPSQDWIDDSLRWRGAVLTGKHAHWCPDWDYLPIDETTPEWPCQCIWPEGAGNAPPQPIDCGCNQHAEETCPMTECPRLKTGRDLIEGGKDV